MSDMSYLRFLIFLLLKLAIGSSSVSEGHGGRTSVGSRSLAPRACILDRRFCAVMLTIGIGGAISGVGARSASP